MFFVYSYWLFESKGRIGTTIGSFHLKPMSNLLEAIAAFKCLYLEKTGNAFGSNEFVKKPGKYNRMTVDHGPSPEAAPDNVRRIEYALSNSTLSESIYNLIDLIFDLNVIKSAWISFDLDLNKMPLGKISAEQMQNATAALKEIEKLLQNQNDATARKIICDASNKFYSLIPHNFGVQRPPLLNTKVMINEKYEILSDMKQMDITYDILTDHDTEGESCPVDLYYRRLRDLTEIMDLDKESDEYKEISSYVTNTALRDPAARVRLELLEVFKVSRREEIGRFAPFERDANRKLLFHGTKITNIVGIMTNGLKLPERNSMLGKGIYFSDSISKSARYCCKHNSTEDGVVLMCEVALGRCENVEIHRNRPVDHNNHPNADALQVLGLYNPRTNHVRPDGLIVPNGALELRINPNGHLLFNEYAVFDEARVKIKYLLKIKVDSTITPNHPNPANVAHLQNILMAAYNPLNLPPA